MSFVVTIYERRLGAYKHGWTTLGLGAATVTDEAGSIPILKERFLQRLKTWVKGTKGRELMRLEQLPGLELAHHRVTIEVGRMSVALDVPLVVERRHTGAGDALTIGYHPLRQEDFFVVDAQRPIVQQYATFLGHLVREAEDEEEIRALHTRKDRLRTLVFDAEIPSLLERVGPPKNAWWQDLKQKPDEQDTQSELDAIATDLSERASEQGLPMGLAREALNARLRAMAERGSVVLIGPGGVGKTWLVHRWVSQRLEEDGYGIHRTLDRVRRVWQLAGRRILAGMKHHGDWEARIAKLIDELRRRRGHLFVPDLPAWSRLGRSRDSERNLADVMRGPLERREVTIVGEATAEAWARLEESAPGFTSQFQVLRVDEPPDHELVRMLVARARELEDGEDSNVVFESSVIDSVREWSAVLYPDRAEPGRSSVLLEEASHHDDYVSEYELTSAITDRAGVPQDLLSHDSSMVGYVPEEFGGLRADVLGQTEATDAMVDLMQTIRIGLTDPARPWGVFMFTGPTGTGKTELAKALAEALYSDRDRLLRIDLNELSGPDAAARLVGGHYGGDPDGRLTAPIMEMPFQVVLLDELEKAHPSVLYLLLQLLDEGRLTDASGRTADFRRAVIVLTSNLGAGAKNPLGFGDEPDASTRRADTTRAVAAALPPELFNRLDRVLAFGPLDRETARQIAERQVGKLAERYGLRARNGTLSTTPALLDLVVRNGFDPEYGARTVKRWIEHHLTDPLANALVQVPGDGFKHALLDADGERVKVAIDALLPAERTWTLPWAHLLSGSPSDCDKDLDHMIGVLAAMDAKPDAVDIIGDVDAVEADKIYWRDQHRAFLKSALRNLRRIRSNRRTPVRDIVAALSNASFVARIAPDIDADIHRVTVILSRPRVRRTDGRLMASLVEAYSGKPWEVEKREARDEGTALRLSGLGIRRALEPELGTHVLETAQHGLEVVTVTVVEGDDLKRVLREHLAAEPTLPPQVRFVRHEIAKTENDARPYEVEDMRSGHAETGHIVKLADLWDWLLTLGRSGARA